MEVQFSGRLVILTLLLFMSNIFSKCTEEEPKEYECQNGESAMSLCHVLNVHTKVTCVLLNHSSHLEKEGKKIDFFKNSAIDQIYLSTISGVCLINPL